MKIIKLLVFILFLSIVNSISYSQEWKVSGAIKGATIEPQYSVIDGNNNLYVIAQFDTLFSPYSIITYGARDLFLFKINSAGSILWYNRIGGPGLEIAGGITLDNNNNCYVSGTYYKTCRFTSTDTLRQTGNGDIFLAQYNSNGAFQWAKRVGSASTLQSSTDLKFDNSDHLIMTGFFKDTLIIGNNTIDKAVLIGNTTSHYVATFIAQFDLNGNHIWSKRFLSTNTLTRITKIGNSENGYYFGGYFEGDLTLDVGTISSYVATTYDAFVYKTDLNGTGEWVRRIRGSGTENFKSLTTDEYDNVYILGNYNSTTIYVDSTSSISKTLVGNLGGYDTYIGKYNRSGILQWFLKKGSTAKDIYNDFVVRNNVIYATGYFTNQIIFNNDILTTSSTTNSDAFLAAFNEIGDPIAGVSIVGTGNFEDAGTIVNMDANSRAYVAGYYKSPQINIGDNTYTSNNINKSDLFFAIYQHPFKAVITDEKMVSCHGLSDGMLKVTPYFGRPPYTYSWSHNASLNSDVATGLAAGTYTITVTDANNQVASISADVTQAASLAVSGIVTPVTCRGYSNGVINITTTGGTHSDDYTYNWTSLNGSGVKPLNKDQNGLTSGDYTVVVIDDNSCSDTADFSVTQPAPFNYKESYIESHTGPTWDIYLSVSGGSIPYDSYSWTGPNLYTSTSQNILGLASGGLYNVTVTDANDCKSDTGFVVNDGTTLIAQVTSKTDVTCFGLDDGTATVTVTNGTGTLSFAWSDGLTTPLNVRTHMAPGTYSVLVTDGSSNQATAPVTIYGPSANVAAVLAPQDLGCNGDNSGVVDLSVSGGTAPFDFVWNNGYIGEDLVNVAAGTYYVVITDANGCSLQPPSVVVNQPTAISLDISQSGSNLCHGDKLVSATANASGGADSFTYLWDDLGAQITKTAYELEAGTYTVIVTDANGCTKNVSTIVTEPDSLSLDAELDAPTCPGGEDGSIITLASGGTGPYDYVWSNSVYNRINNNITAGDYTLTVTDHNSCQLIREYTLTDPDSTRIASVDFTDVSCLGLNDGSITIGASGGNGTYDYSIDNGVTFVPTSAFSPLSNDDYILVVKDGNDCLSKTYTLTLGVSDTVKISQVDVTDVSCLGLSNGSIAITATGGDANYTYSFDGGTSFVSTSSVGSLPNNDYTLLARDGIGCTSESQMVTVGIDDTLKITWVDFKNVTCLGLSDGYIAIDATGGTGDYEYSTNGGDSYASEDSVTSLPNGDYSIIVRDAQGCSSEVYPLTLINEDTVSITSVDYTDLTCSGINDGTITVVAKGGNGTYMYSSDGGTSFYTGSVIDSLTTGSYTVVVRDGNNCRSDEYPLTLNKTDVCGLFIYDAFSPNDDGKNDVWNIGNAESYPDIDVKIFNIWGKMVFSSKGYSKPWDGEYEGKDLPSGTYYYVIDPGDGSKTLTGPVSIVK